jgi:phage terminase large subunit
MTYTITTAVHKILTLRHRLRILQGGSSAGKTVAVLLILIDRAQIEKDKVFSVVSETIPHLKKGAIRDFLAIMEGHGYYNDARWNRTDFIYTFENGSKLEFFSADSPDKVRGPRRNVLFINEANNISYETYTQLAIRTSEEIYIDYNPVSEFWVHEEIIDKRDKDTGEPLVEHDFLILTYKDNEGLPESVVKELESRRTNLSWWKVYGEGQLGGAEGVIYPRWRQIDSIPEGARLERYGLDFGYTNDPTVIVAVYYYNQGYILDEILFQKGVSNKQIADTLLAQEHKAIVVADSAEPKSIDEIRSYGVNMIPAVKGQGSVLQGIQIVQDQDISVTKRSTNVIKANKNYVWETDMDGKPTNKPDHFWSDAMDAVRYAMGSIAPLKARIEMVSRMPFSPRKVRVNPAR